ncbi:Histidine--tRNA ligase [Buchnera aphidicola (Tetraneura ulmi)]|uniref:histidine--tRNA ligase n=1 Tax=Buchnera aphidicola TaxID=9 RepID=UPI003464C21B
MDHKFQSMRGIHDYLPKEIYLWNYIEKILKKILKNYCYSEIRIPIMEKTFLFKKTIGSITDIFEKEMYSFIDLGGNKISLRPEGTAGCVRACIENGLLHNQVQKLWYLGPMFRYERPQKGRYRQFYQFGVETFGYIGIEIDLELILITIRLWKKLNILSKLKLEINSIGSKKSRSLYESDLKKFLYKNKLYLDKKSIHRMYKNPIRVLDSKNKNTQKILKDAPILKDYLDNLSSVRFKNLCIFLDEMKIKYELNSHLVRGLDYYNDTVFEWKINDDSSSKKTICAGGRYDKLVENIGGKFTPAMGFAIGMERLILMYKNLSIINKSNSHLNLDINILISELDIEYLKLIEKIRNCFSNLRIKVNFINLSKKKKIEFLNNTKISIVLLILKKDEKSKKIILKNFKTGEIKMVFYKDVTTILKSIF